MAHVSLFTTGTDAIHTISSIAHRPAVALRLLDGRDDLREARVAFLVAPGFDWIAIQWGIWRAGGIAVPLPMSHPPAELDYLIRDSGASIVIADADNAAVDRACRDLVRRAVLSGDDSRPRAPTSHDPYDPYDPHAPPDRRALIVYTSGTTGRPKGVVTTHGALSAQIQSLITRVGMDVE